MIVANITVSLDGYVSGPDPAPSRGLGIGGERLHHWVFGAPWTYDQPPAGEMTGEDSAFFDEWIAPVGAVVAGRATYDAADGWGGTNPWRIPCVVLTHRTADEPPGAGFRFVDGFDAALGTAGELAEDRSVLLMGGADVIRQGLAAGVVDELALSFAPVVLGGGTRLFDGFDRDVELEPISVRQSPYATHVRHRVRR